MTQPGEPLPPHLAEASKVGAEISITCRWVPTKTGGLFRKSSESPEMLQEWEDILADAKADPGVLSDTIGKDACLSRRHVLAWRDQPHVLGMASARPGQPQAVALR